MNSNSNIHPKEIIFEGMMQRSDIESSQQVQKVAPASVPSTCPFVDEQEVAQLTGYEVNSCCRIRIFQAKNNNRCLPDWAVDFSQCSTKSSALHSLCLCHGAVVPDLCCAVLSQRMNPASALKLARPNWANLYTYKKAKNSMLVQKWDRGNFSTIYKPIILIFLDNDTEQVQPQHCNKTQLYKILKTV